MATDDIGSWICDLCGKKTLYLRECNRCKLSICIDCGGVENCHSTTSGAMSFWHTTWCKPCWAAHLPAHPDYWVDEAFKLALVNGPLTYLEIEERLKLYYQVSYIQSSFRYLLGKSEIQLDHDTHKVSRVYND